MSQAEQTLSQATKEASAEGRGDPVRRAVGILLMIYLAPALLVVFVVGGLGVALCATVQWCCRLMSRPGSASPVRGRRPHLVAAGQPARSGGG